MLCRAIPYEGNEPYIFLSYCHKDAADVYPLLEQLVLDGFRVWYDDGNRPGDDWPENIAQHLNNSHLCLSIMTPNAIGSHNCRNEINFAVEIEKKLVTVMMEEFSMPLGMQMQLSTTHFLKKKEYPSLAMMLGKLYDVTEMKHCRTVPGSLPMRQLPSASSPAAGTKHTSKINQFVQDQKQYFQVNQEPQKPAPSLPETEPSAASPAVEEAIPETPAVKDVFTVSAEQVTPVEQTVPAANPEISEPSNTNQDPKPDEEASSPDETIRSPLDDGAETEYLKPEQIKPILLPKTEPVKTVEISENCESVKKEVSPVEETATEAEEKTVPSDKTVAPKEDSKPVVFTPSYEEEAPSDVTKLLVLPPEDEPIDRTVLLEEDACDTDRTVQAKAYKEVILISLSGKQGYVLRSGHIKMGRSEQKCDVVIPNNLFISSHHADIIFYGGHYYLKDAESINGTFINEEILESGSRVLLQNPACFRLHNERFILITGETAQKFIKLGKVYFLRNVQTHEIMLIQESPLILNRSHRWPGGTLNDLGISRRQHAEVHLRDGALYLEDKACANGVFLNVRRLEENQTCRLESGDAITLGSTTLEVGIITL